LLCVVPGVARLAGVLDLYFEKNKDQSLDVFEPGEKRVSGLEGGKYEDGPSLLNITGRLSMRSGEMSWMV
jgi:hypothetical protein